MPKGYCKPLTDEDTQKIKDEYLLKPIKRLADELDITYGRVMRFLNKNNLIIPKELIEQRKKDSRKKKGDIPFNKGLKQSEYMSKESIEATRKTRFKKGRKPHNTKYDGHERIGRDGYTYVRIKEGVYKLKHVVLFEKQNGKILDGNIVVFKDGNKQNFDIDNLESISKIENMYRNSVHDYPEEIIPSLVLNRKIQLKIKNIENGKK